MLLVIAGCATQPPADILSLSPNHFAGNIYIVKPKDTIYSIAREQHVDHQTLARINHIMPPFTIYTGQRLIMRAGAGKIQELPSNVAAKDHQPLVPQANNNFADSKTEFSSANGATKVSSASAASASITKPQNKPLPTAAAITAASNSSIAKNKPAGNNAAVTTQRAQAESPGQQEEVVKAASTLEVDNARKRVNWIWPTRGPILSRFAKGATLKNGINIGGSEGTAIKAVAPGKVVYSGSGLRGYGHLIIIKHQNDFLSAYAHNKKNLVQEGAEVKIGQLIAEMGKTGSNRVMLHFEVRHNGVPIDPEKVLPKR